MDSRENSYDDTGEGIGVPYQESGPPASPFRGREEILTSLVCQRDDIEPVWLNILLSLLQASTPVNVFTGTSEDDYPAGTRPQKEKTCTVVPPTKVGGGSRFDFTVTTSSTTEDRADPEVTTVYLQTLIEFVL